MNRLLAALLVTLAGSVAQAQDDGGPRVERVVMASATAHDATRLGDRTFVATDAGLLVLRNGHVEHRMGAQEGLPGTRLRSVSVVDGELWVGAVEGTARVSIDGDAPVVRRLYEPRRVRRVVRFGDAIFMASYGGGLHRLRGERLDTVTLGGPHAYRRLTDLIVQGGDLLIATQGVGILRMRRDGRVRGRVRRRDGLPSPYLWRFSRIDDDQILVTSIDGVAVLGPDGVQRSHPFAATARRLPVRDVRDAVVTSEGLWLGTFGRGLFRAPLNGGRPRAIAQVGGVHALLAGERDVWVAHTRGLARASGRTATPITEGGLASSDVSAMARAFGTVFIGTFGHGLARLRGGRVEAIDTERWSLDRRINDLAVTGRGRTQRLWIATDRGLYWHDGRLFSRVEDPDGPSWIHNTSLHVDRAGSIWVTTGRELCRHRAQRWSCWTGDSTFPVAQLHAVTTDASGRVWVGGLHGLYEFDVASASFERHTVSSGELPVDWVTALVPWGRGVMAGTYHGGLSIGSAAGFRIVHEGQGGLPSGWVNPHAIQLVGGEAWIGTLERGLMVGRPGAWYHLTMADGLPSDDVTDVLADADGVWVATRGGLARVSR